MRTAVVRLMLVFLLPFLACPAMSASAAATPERDSSPSGKILVVKLRQNISLDELLKRERYSIDDVRMVDFLRDFLGLNSDIKSISRLKKGSAVRLPLKHMTRTSAARQEAPVHEETFFRAPTKVPQRSSGRIQAETRIQDRTQFLDLYRLDAIRALYRALGRDVTIEHEGMRMFQVGNQRELVLDASQYPMIDLHNQRVMLLDITNALPQEIKDIIEISWPEYHVVTTRGARDLKSLVAVLLNESGYLVSKSDRIVSGGRTQIEYRPDFFVEQRDANIPAEDLLFISVLGTGEMRTPQGLLAWFEERGIRLLELAPDERESAKTAGGDVISMTSGLEARRMVGDLLAVFGYPFLENSKIVVSGDKGVSYSVAADYLIETGGRKKAVVFAELSKPERAYLAKSRYDLLGIDRNAGPIEAATQVSALVSSQWSTDARANAQRITPQHARYRLLFPGTYAAMPKGKFFLTSADIGNDLMREIVAKGIYVVKF